MKKVYKVLSFLLCLSIVLTLCGATTQVQAFDKKAAKKKVSVTYRKVPNGVLAIYKNKNSYAVTLSGTMKFYDGASNVMSKETQKNNCLAAKKTATFLFKMPTDQYGNSIQYTKYKASYSVNSTKYKSAIDNISVNCELKPIQAQGVAVYNGKKTLSNVNATLVFYDGNDNIVSCKTKYLSCYTSNAIDQFTVNYDLESYVPSKYKIYINWAY